MKIKNTLSPLVPSKRNKSFSGQLKKMRNTPSSLQPLQKNKKGNNKK